jgi:hypothetical protein
MDSRKNEPEEAKKMKTKKQEILENGLEEPETKKAKKSKKKGRKKISKAKKTKTKKVFEPKDEVLETQEIETTETEAIDTEQEPEQDYELKNHVADPETASEPKQTRHALMLRAKEKGIKNFRVLNKAELAQILSDTIMQEEIDVVVKGAVARWKSGWGFKKNKAEIEFPAV